MISRNWVLCGGLAAGLTLALAAAVHADSTSGSPPATPPTAVPDPPGTTPYMDKLRAVFAAWDLNHDNFLDKAELAKAFRGADAKPYDYKKPTDASADPSKDATTDPPKDSTSTKKPDYSQYQDYNFLVQLDQDGDGQISRDEFMSWARDYAVQLKQQADQETKMLAMEAKMQKASAKEAKTLEKEYKKEEAVLNKLNTQMNASEKALLQQLKKR